MGRVHEIESSGMQYRIFSYHDYCISRCTAHHSVTYLVYLQSYTTDVLEVQYNDSHDIENFITMYHILHITSRKATVVGMCTLTYSESVTKLIAVSLVMTCNS